MGFFDDEVDGAFDEQFDFDGDGYLDPEERMMQMDYLDDTTLTSDCDYDQERREEIAIEIEGMDFEEACDYIESEGFDVSDFDV